MAYTVKKLAKLSGVSVRTLHYYDEIGLLKPAYIGDNNYRYYEQGELLMLQQILFYREIGLPLSDIQRIVTSNDFDKLEALKSHRHVLEIELKRFNKLIGTIDKTISHLEGKEKMKDQEMYYGFDSEKQKQHEKYLIERGMLTQDFLNQCNEKIKNWSDSEKMAFTHDLECIMKGLIAAIEDNVSPDDQVVQTLMKEHFSWLERTWYPTKESYIELARLYQTPEFRKFYDDRHPKLLEFIVSAMKIYADREL